MKKAVGQLNNFLKRFWADGGGGSSITSLVMRWVKADIDCRF